jgi:hypothetical protein
MKDIITKVYKWNPNGKVYVQCGETPHLIERMGWLNRQDCKYWKKKSEEKVEEGK